MECANDWAFLARYPCIHQGTAVKLFKCQSCGQLLYFENTSCERCSHRLGYLPQVFTISAVEPEGG